MFQRLVIAAQFGFEALFEFIAGCDGFIDSYGFILALDRDPIQFAKTKIRNRRAGSFIDDNLYSVFLGQALKSRAEIDRVLVRILLRSSCSDDGF